MSTSEARIATKLATRYLSQLCKHFAHRLPVTLEDTTGSITFGMGICNLASSPDTLVLRATSETAEQRGELEGVVARHLERFAFREPVTIVWEEK